MKLMILLLGAFICLISHAVCEPVTHCYQCTNQLFGLGTYDEQCGMMNYDGHTAPCGEGCAFLFCATMIHSNGKVERRWAISDIHVHGQCKVEKTKTTCFCFGENCNSGLCGHCDTPWTLPPPPTTEPPTTEPPTDLTTLPPTDESHCYQCTNQLFGLGHYDELCGHDNYHGFTAPCGEDCSYQFCATMIYPTGKVERRWAVSNRHVDGECKVEAKKTTCFCLGENCNRHLCDHCDTPWTLPPPTDLTTKPPTTPTTQSTTEATTTTQPPVDGIMCFDCQNYNQAWDNYDKKCADDNYSGSTYFCSNCKSCFTKVAGPRPSGSWKQVTRGEAGAFGDGECHKGSSDIGATIQCYCTSDECNNDLCQDCP